MPVELILGQGKHGGVLMGAPQNRQSRVDWRDTGRAVLSEGRPVNTDLMEEIFQFVSGKTGRRPDRIGPRSRLFGDLGVDGDDARELMAAFASRFNVGLLAFEFGRHFGNEGIWPHQYPIMIWRAFRRLRGCDPHEIAGFDPITVEDLVRAVEAGRWNH